MKERHSIDAFHLKSKILTNPEDPVSHIIKNHHLHYQKWYAGARSTLKENIRLTLTRHTMTHDAPIVSSVLGKYFFENISPLGARGGQAPCSAVSRKGSPAILGPQPSPRPCPDHRLLDEVRLLPLHRQRTGRHGYEKSEHDNRQEARCPCLRSGKCPSHDHLRHSSDAPSGT